MINTCQRALGWWRWCALGVAVVFAGCAEVGQSQLSIALHAEGTPWPEEVVTRRGARVVLQRAELAFGPLYLCASTEAGESCDTARAEWIESAVVDTLDPDAQPLGVLDAITGSYRSMMYDLGITSLLTQRDPLVLPAAQQLGGASVVLEGTVIHGGGESSFELAMPLARTSSTEQGVPLVRVRLPALQQGVIDGSARQLNVRFDARAWVDDIDFDVLCTGDVCDAAIDDNQASRALRIALTAGTPPTLSWGE